MEHGGKWQALQQKQETKLERNKTGNDIGFDTSESAPVTHFLLHQGTSLIQTTTPNVRR